jgi:hypothetical protein
MKKVFAILAAAMLLPWSVNNTNAQNNVTGELVAIPIDYGVGFYAVFHLENLYPNQNYEAVVRSGSVSPTSWYQDDISFSSNLQGEATFTVRVDNHIVSNTMNYLDLKVYYDDQSSGWMVGHFGQDYSMSHETGDDKTPLVIVDHTNPNEYHSMDVSVKIVPRSTYPFEWTFCSGIPGVPNSYEEDWMGPLPIVPGDTVHLDTTWTGLDASEMKDVGVRISAWNPFYYNKAHMTEIMTADPEAPNAWLEEHIFNGSNLILQGGIEYKGSPTMTDFRVTEVSSGGEVWTDAPVNRGAYSGTIGEQIFNVAPGEEYLVELFAWNEIDSVVAATTITIPANLLGVEDGKDLAFSWYPNPAKDHLVIEAKEDAELSILDISGRIMWQEPILIGTNRIDLQLPQGTFFLDLLTEDGRKTEKFIVQ